MGRLPGHGRPKGSVSVGTVRAFKIKERLCELFEKEADALHAAQLDQPKGLFVGITHPTSGEIIRVYKKVPSTEAYKTLLEQCVGRPIQPVEHSGEIILPSPIVAVEGMPSPKFIIDGLLPNNSVQENSQPKD